jgi:hypothetical protein
MKLDDLIRFGEDLQRHAGIPVGLFPDSSPEGMHVLRISGVDFFSALTGQRMTAGAERSPRKASKSTQKTKGMNT